MKRKRIPETILKRVGARFEWRCASCSNVLGAVFELDHETPLHAGGSDDEHNLRPLCPHCHALKTQTERVEATNKRRAAVAAAKRAAGEMPKPRPLTLEEETAAFCSNRFLAFAYDGTSRLRR